MPTYIRPDSKWKPLWTKGAWAAGKWRANTGQSYMIPFAYRGRNARHSYNNDPVYRRHFRKWRY